jgi:molybdate transport system permease protein
VDTDALSVSLRLAGATTIILLVVAIPLAAWIAFTRRRFAPVVEAIVALPIVLPPTVLGFYLLVALGAQSPLGRWWIDRTGEPIAFSFTALVIASVISSLPFAVQPLVAAFAGLDRRLLEASTILGRSWFGTIWRVALPLSRAGLVTAGVLTFAHTIGEFGVVLMVGGNIPGVTRTLSIDIYDNVQAFDYSSAATTSVLLLLFSVVVLTTVYVLRRRGIRGWVMS